MCMCISVYVDECVYECEIGSRLYMAYVSE